jgi:HK97 family phage prohead protease
VKIIRLYQKLFDSAPAAAPPDVTTRTIVGAQSPGLLRGMATTYNELSTDFGGYRLRILPGAFSRSLKSDAILACWMHDNAEIVGSTKNKSLRLIDDARGLRVELDVAPTSRGFDSFALVAGGFVGEMSIGLGIAVAKFTTAKLPNGDKISVEDVSQAILYEVSIVAKGAMPGTSIQAITTAPANPIIRQSQPMTDRQRLDNFLRRQSLGSSRPTASLAEALRAIRRYQTIAN